MTNFSDFRVGFLGFSETERQKLRRILQLSRQRDKRYHEHAVPAECRLLVVNADQPGIQVRLKASPAAKVVSLSKQQDVFGAADIHLKGLILASRIIKAMDELAVSPPVVIDESAPAPIACQTPATENNPAPGYRVLVVDDSAAMRQNLAEQLQRADGGFVIDFAESGDAALEKVKHHHYDFLFLDIMMPGIDGYDACAKIRKNPAMKKTPIIMLSAKTSPLDEVKGVMAGCTSYLTKPIVPEEFQKMLRRIVQWLEQFNTQTNKGKQLT